MIQVKCYKIILPHSGVVFINPCIDVWTRVDTRARAFSVPPQQVLIKISTIIYMMP